MHPRTSIKTKEITKTVLELLALTSGATLVAFLGQGRGADKFAYALGLYGARRIRETIKRLRLQRYVQYNIHDATSPILLTEKGMTRALHYRFIGLKTKKKKWDYLWRMVIFDIPERQKHLRELFRNELRVAGFFLLQRSIFVSPYTCEKEIDDLCDCWRIKKYVLVFITASLGSAEERVRRHFFGRTL